MMQQPKAPFLKAASPSTHIPSSVAPYEPDREMMLAALEDELTFSALCRTQGRPVPAFDRTFFDGPSKLALARMYALDGEGRVVWVHPKALSTLLHLCNHSDRIADKFVARVKSGRVRGMLELRLLGEGSCRDAADETSSRLADYIESIPARLVKQLKDFVQVDKFRLAVEALPGASMTHAKAVAAIESLIAEHGVDRTAAATLAALGRGVLPIRQTTADIDTEMRLLYAVATLVDPERVARPSPDEVGLALVALKARRLGRAAGVDPAFAGDPAATLVADLAWALRSIDAGESQLRTRMTQVEIVDAHFTNISDTRALSLLLSDAGHTRLIADDEIAGALMRLIGTSAFLREELPYQALQALMTQAQRILGARRIETRITAESCRLTTERTVKYDWLTRAGMIRRIRRYGSSVVERRAA